MIIKTIVALGITCILGGCTARLCNPCDPRCLFPSNEQTECEPERKECEPCKMKVYKKAKR